MAASGWWIFLAGFDPALHVLVRPHLHAVVEADGLTTGLPVAGSSEPIIFVNARLAPRAALLAEVQALLMRDTPLVVRHGNTVLLARVPAEKCPTQQQLSPQLASATLLGLGLPSQERELPIFDYPHDIVRHHLTSLSGNLDYRLANGEYQQIADGVFAAPGATLGQHVVTDSRQGPILLEREALVGPFCFLRGHCTWARRPDSSNIPRPRTACRSATPPRSAAKSKVRSSSPTRNKQHHGFLGHSYLGSWVNLGAGTCNSDLKNTYGHVNMEYHGLQGADRHAVRRCDRRRIRQDGDQHRHLYRQDRSAPAAWCMVS